MFKVIIAGGRDFNDYDLLKVKMNRILSNITDEIVVISGTARGADSLGEKYATEMGYKLEQYPANWNKYGKRAGYLRNKQMADVAHACVCFWDSKSKGTKHMIDLANEKKLKLRVVKY